MPCTSTPGASLTRSLTGPRRLNYFRPRRGKTFSREDIGCGWAARSKNPVALGRPARVSVSIPWRRGASPGAAASLLRSATPENLDLHPREGSG